MTVSGGLESLH